MTTENGFRGRYAFLSNFAPCSIYHRGATFRTLEHAFQAAKTDDQQWRERIAVAPTPQQAKVLGRKCPLRGAWDDEKLDVMLELLRIKFGKNGNGINFHRQMLKQTGDTELIEHNAWGDTFWGICEGKGENNLGILLMLVRSEIL